MLEGAVARLLNQFLGKYVVDLDTENLNVGIFSGQVQLTDLKLKPEALYELKLPIEVKAGTIGKIIFQIPWTYLWSQPIVVNIEDLHIIAGPIVSRQEPFDAEKNKRLLRAAKKQILVDLDANGEVVGGPSSFAEHLVSNILNYLQLNIVNVHIRYEDEISWKHAVAGGVCIGSLTAETTNSKWRPAKYDKNANACFYMVKVEAFSVYWNSNVKLKKWDLPSQYYQWRNTMAASLKNYSMNDEDFNFVLNPMVSKVKIVITKGEDGKVAKLHTDVVVQDCNLQLSKEQHDSMLAVSASMERMEKIWPFLPIRPKEKIADNPRIWWRYAGYALLEQRVKPYTWSRMRRVRQHYKQYLETYKQIILNPNDTEMKLDLQKFEDHLSIVNVVLARQQARLTVQARSIGEKSFWSLLPSPERILLCEKIGYFDTEKEDYKETIDHHYTFRLGNLNLSATSRSKEILVLTLTQTIASIRPNYAEQTYRATLKIEGLIVEGWTGEEHLMPVISSEHLSDSPAYFFKMDLEKMPKTSKCKYKLSVTMDAMECIYNKPSIEELETFLTVEHSPTKNVLSYLANLPRRTVEVIRNKMLDNWDLNLNIKIPYLVFPEVNSYLKAEYLLVIDLGLCKISTELCTQTAIAENATQMELEEQLYSKLLLRCNDLQVLFCDAGDNWKDACKEKDTEMHVVTKTSFSSIYALSAVNLITMPRYKFNVSFQTLKLNVSERKVGLLLKFFNVDNIKINVTQEEPKLYDRDIIKGRISSSCLKEIQNKIRINSSYAKYKRYKVDNCKSRKFQNIQSASRRHHRDMNEAWARCVDLPGLEDNISPNNTIDVLYGFEINEFSMVFSRSSDSTDRQYLVLRLGLFSMDVALMTYGPAYQISLNSLLLTDKLHTTPSGQYLDLIFSPVSSNQDLVTVLYRKVSAKCPDFWTHFHGVETSLVANLETFHLLLHQEAVHTILKYSKYMSNKIRTQTSPFLKTTLSRALETITNILHVKTDTPVPPGSIKFSHSARLADLNITVCDSDFDIVDIRLSGLEMDFLFRANERFVFRSFLSNISVEHLSDITLYSKVLYTDEDKVFDIKYVRNAAYLNHHADISPNTEDSFIDGSFKFHLGRVHCTFLYKLIVQLQRFVLNLDAMPFLETVYCKLQNTATDITKTLRNNTKINLAINVCGPVLIIPQKSASPNVLVLDTGELKVENFFKGFSAEVTENILVKLNGVTASRGVMTLTSTLEMQETLIEPITLNMDIKRYTNSRTTQNSVEIDSVIDTIHVTLGQRDLTTITAIYTDNIGEGKLLDLFPLHQLNSPGMDTAETREIEDSVRTLEAFFSEPKQKNVVAKCTIEEVKLMLFFDSGELLSSPIRDLSHGLCKLEIIDIDISCFVYNDKSLDGKVSVDTVFVEEIGPEAHATDKVILQSPRDDNKNNNCHITVNKPPIVDITFHQNKTGDKSADVIVGRLSLVLSIPFGEKLALFIIECLPKEHNDSGIVNAGYEAEVSHTAPQKTHHTSLTLSVRVNKPDLMFLVETTSNKKRYFITKSEILIDYSRHANRLNLVMSLSGLHSLFYDLGEYSEEPYVILKQCDLELCKSFSSESGEKITLAVSSIYLKMCSEVVHSINDILNDIVEHFKVPETEPVTKQERKKSVKTPEQPEDLWEPKKLQEFTEKYGLDSKTDNTISIHEIFLVPKFDIVVIFELEQVQVLMVKSTVELTVYDWSSILNCTCELTLQANYFNENVHSWEPLIEPVVVDEKEYKPWEVIIKVFQDKSLPMLDDSEYKPRVKQFKKKCPNRSVTTTEDEDSGEDMMYLEPLHHVSTGANRRVKTSLSTFLDDSDSENEDGTMERLAAAISDLFTGDWNENEDSDCEPSSDEEDNEDNEKPSEKVDMNFNKSYYVLMDAKETFNLTISPTIIKMINELLTQYSNKIISVRGKRKFINLANDIGPQAKIELYEKMNSDENRLLSVKKYEKEDSAPSSPSRGLYYPEYLDTNYDDKDSCTDEGKEDAETTYDFETLSSLQFPDETTSQLFDKINKNFMKIFVPNFLPVQTNCSRRNWSKLIRLHSVDAGQMYHLAATHHTGKSERMVVVSSPLQVKNETCFALSILYQPSILQQMNLEPVGDITNPFETTMRIAVLEPLEEYNVPLYIAYHCKLFVQPAYAEAHYASESGIWWKDLATELDTAHNIYCKPKVESQDNHDIFSVRVTLRRNVATKSPSTQSIPNYVIHLLPPMFVHNFLPYAIEVLSVGLKQIAQIEPGERTSVYSLDSTKDQKLFVRVKHDATTWSGNLNLTRYLDEKIIALSSVNKEDAHNLIINVKSDEEGSCNLFFYTPYWIVNKTGLQLQIKASASNLIYKCLNENIILFTYKRHVRQTLAVRVYDSNWSNEFGLECSGTTGLVVCKDVERKKKYMFFLNIRLSSICPRLTKIVTILPSFLVINNTEKPLRYMEHNERTDLWTDLAPGQVNIFWPETSSMEMYVKYRDSKLGSHSFFISTQHRTVLRIDKGAALTVEVTGGMNDSFRISFEEYKAGDAPVLIENYCADLFLKIQQLDLSPATLLSPYHSLLFTWDDPTRPRQLVWNVYNNKGTGFSVDVTKDGYGEEKIRMHSVTPTTAGNAAPPSSSSEDSDSSEDTQPQLNKKVRKDKLTIYWACYRAGLQRTLLLTQELRVYEGALKTFRERCNLVGLIALSGVGMSVFTSEEDEKEHIYVALSDTPATWEVNVGQKWKTLTLELASWIEDKYRLHYKKCQLKEYVHIDFEKMFMLKPFFAELRRSYKPAVYFHFRKSQNHRYFDLRLQSFQIDNKQTANIIVHPLPSQNLKEPPPFARLVLSKLYSKEADIYRYVKIRLDSFFVNLESETFLKVAELLGTTKIFHGRSTRSYVDEIKAIHRSITVRNNTDHPRTIIEYLAMSNFGLQLNISNNIHLSLAGNEAPCTTVLDHLFPYNISPYMPLEGVHHKISSMEHVGLSGPLCDSICLLLQQAATQFLQQYYSHVLGLQVLVNTFAIQPVIEISEFDSEKMADIVLYGSRCLLGHVNMSPAAVEACVVSVFANQNIDNIQRIRRHGSYHKSEIVPKATTISSRNFTSGVPNALRQLLVNNQNAGINCDGEMFFRTTGKALYSLITRHPDEKSDTVEVAREALRRAWILGEPIKIHQRLTRYKNKYIGLRPLSVHESMGHHLLETIGNSRFVHDTYWAHAAIDKIGKSLVIVSLEHVIKINKCRLWGPWEIEWVTELDDIISMPKINCTELTLMMRQNDVTTERMQQIKITGEKVMLSWLQEKIEQAIIVSMEDKSWAITENQ